jgi:hypothetical protein
MTLDGTWEIERFNFIEAEESEDCPNAWSAQ